MSQPGIDKLIWTEQDFDLMDWHDATLYGVAFLPDRFEFLLDIDYIVRWVQPDDSTYFSFLVSPATMILENVHDLSVCIAEPYRAIQIQSIKRDDPKPPPNAAYSDKRIEWQWTIDLEVGEITFSSVGFRQVLRKQPVETNSQSLHLSERGGISFDTGPHS